MLRPVGDQPGLWESTLPPALLVLPEQLAQVDELLADPAFFAAFMPFIDPRIVWVLNWSSTAVTCGIATR